MNYKLNKNITKWLFNLRNEDQLFRITLLSNTLISQESQIQAQESQIQAQESQIQAQESRIQAKDFELRAIKAEMKELKRLVLEKFGVAV